MKRFAWLVLFVLVGCSRTNVHPTDHVGTFLVSVTNEPSPPRTGENALVVRVEDANGLPVRGATIDAVVSMPAMGAMPYMESRGKTRESAPGEYRVAYGLSMAGEWDVTLKIAARGSEPADGRWRISTRLKDVAFAGGASDSAQAPGALVLDAAKRQAIGVRTAKVELRPFTLAIRARGTVTYDETARAAVSMRYGGWVRTLSADFVGKPVVRGQALFTVDSPEITSAQEEYVSALRFASAELTSERTGYGNDAPSLADAARRRLLAFGLTEAQVAQVARTGKPIANLAVVSPSSGVVVDKAIVPGSPFSAGQVLLSIATVDPVWIEARLYEADLPYVRVGQLAHVTGVDARERTGRVTFVAPSLDPATRTGMARVSLANPGGALKPGMFVDVALEAVLGSRLAVPEGAVVPTGTRQVVFVDKGGGRLEPREVTVGARSGDWVAIERGLSEGETVVASGNFLVAADARLRSALSRW